MSDDIARPEARPLTAMIAGGDSQAKNHFFLTTMRHAAAFVVIQHQEGTITADECQDGIDALQAMSEELRFGGSCACATCGEGTNYLFIDNATDECVWCIQARKAECQHLNFSDNLTGATCDDCGVDA